MKKPVLLLGILFLALTTSLYAQERNCAAMDDLEQRLQEDPTLEQRMQDIEEFTRLKVSEMEQNRTVDGNIITIPVVINVLYNNATTNISNAQIQSQLDVLNEDFRRTNSDADNTWSQAADTEIQFCLASVDPNGNSTTGIRRKSTTQQDWFQNTNNMKKDAQGGISPWNTAEYLNMWTVPRLLRSNGDVLLGFAQFPGGPASTDGVVMGYNYFGATGAVTAPFDLGRTTTHEVGHFLNLRHIWGDGGCGVDDFVSDTPESDASNGGCNPSHVSCGTVDMVQNYMDYSNDSCMNLFTQGQTDRMRATLVAGGVRRTLALSDKCGSAPTPTCTDGVQNGDETGVDCGGSSCAPCQTACASTISSFPYGESFESSFGAWTNSTADDINWTRDGGGTPSGNTGPSTGADGSTYIFVEASGNGTGYPNKTAILNSPCFDLAGATNATFTFSYHMYGAADMGDILLQASTDGATWNTLFSDTGNQGNVWNDESIDLSAYLNNTVQLRFSRTTGSTWQADIALDAIGLSTGSGGGGTSCTTAETLPYDESFETNLGDWSQSSADDIDWTRDSAGTPSGSTGPSNGADGSFYSYVEASGNGTGYPNKSAILNSPCFDLSSATSATFTFNYHMYGSNDMGTIALEASADGNNWTSVWNESGNKGNSWLAASVDLSSYAGGDVRLRFNRVTGGTWQADIAIDNINFTAGSGGGSNPPTGYCASNGNNTNDEFIQRVQMGSINNNTGASPGGYGDYTNISTNLATTNSITITPEWTGTVYSEGYAVWVDWNRDGDFGDSGELVFSRAATQDTSVSGSFSVPSGASPGATRMRVSMKYNGIPTSCESFQYGEVEDYTVVIPGSARVIPGEISGNELSIYPNPVKGGILNVSLLEGGVDYVVYTITGQIVARGTYTNTVDVTSLQSGIYIIQVNTDTTQFVERFIKE